MVERILSDILVIGNFSVGDDIFTVNKSGYISIGTSSNNGTLTVQSIGTGNILNLIDDIGDIVFKVSDGGKFGFGVDPTSALITIPQDQGIFFSKSR